MFSGSFLDHICELKFVCSLCLLSARGLSTTSLFWEQLMQKHLHCNLMRLIKHCSCKHHQIYKTVCVQQQLGAAINGDSGSHHPSSRRRAQLMSQPSPHSYAAGGMSVLVGCSQSCKGEGLLERCQAAMLPWCRQGKQQKMVWGWGQESIALALCPLPCARCWGRKVTD